MTQREMPITNGYDKENNMIEIVRKIDPNKMTDSQKIKLFDTLVAIYNGNNTDLIKWLDVSEKVFGEVE